MEMAALKAIMLTLDEVLADSGKRFTRSPLLHRTRILVQQVMKEGALPRPEEYLPVVLGIQYDRIDDVLSARARLELPVQPFEHTLAVSGDVASRSLDVVWLCAGVDPWAFRLSSNWTEEDFTYVFAVGTTTLGPERASNWFAGPTSLCQPSIYRMLSPDLENDEFEARVLLPVASRRAEAYRKAVDLVERNCPAEVQDGLLSIARTRSPDQPVSVAALLRERLRRLFYRRLENGATAKAFDEIVKARMLQLDTASAQQMVVAGDEGSVQAVDWGGWHRVFVEVLDDLLSVAGLPGETFSICFRQESAP
ncbi:MAG: hypothetical protein HUU35_15730 [Armatimonadetes bacterium]|nr:hypothetical protein [Armatimonadota bacterium]